MNRTIDQKIERLLQIKEELAALGEERRALVTTLPPGRSEGTALAVVVRLGGRVKKPSVRLLRARVGDRIMDECSVWANTGPVVRIVPKRKPRKRKAL
jgi:hypothetical protein